MSSKQQYPGMTSAEMKSFKQKTNSILDYIFGKSDNKEVIYLGKDRKKRILGLRPIQPVKINGVVYGSMSIASKELHLSLSTIRNRCESISSEFRGYSYIKPPKHKR